jgi:hypothetical protein
MPLRLPNAPAGPESRLAGRLAFGIAFLAAGAAAQSPGRSDPAAPASRQPATTPTVIQIALEPSGDVLAPEGPFAFDPASPRPYDITPPLSIYESRLMLRKTMNELQEVTLETLPARFSRLDFMLESVARYIRWVDRAHTTLPYYLWTDLGDDKVRSTNWRAFTFRCDAPRKDVNAVTLSVHHGDVMVQQMTVTQDDGRRWQFAQPIAIRAGQPSPEVFFLPLPSKVVEVEVRCRWLGDEEDHTPRLFVQTGVCTRSESGKQAVYYIQRARFDLRQGRLEPVAGYLNFAHQSLADFQKDRRL